MPGPRRFAPTRRAVVALAAALLTSCHATPAVWHSTDVSGSTPDLRFTMARARDGQTVTAADYRGKIVLLYFGYTYCPDVCPLTMSRLAQALAQVKGAADNVRVLFVTVDPERDDAKALKDYVANFGPEFVGLRGSPDELATLAKRYRIAYSVHPDPDPTKYVVTHSSAIYAFDRSGKARLLITGLSSQAPDIKGAAEDVQRLVADGD
ncbi:MAG: SCO family protein [Sphingomonas sp.]